MRRLAAVLKVDEEVFLMCAREVVALETAKALYEQRRALIKK